MQNLTLSVCDVGRGVGDKGVSGRGVKFTVVDTISMREDQHYVSSARSSI